MLEKAYLPEHLRGPRVRLYRHEESEAFAQVMFQSVDSDRERLREFLPWVATTQSVADSYRYICETRMKWLKHEMFDFGVFRLGSDGSQQYCGNIGVHHMDWGNASCEIGYWILGAYEGLGLMSEAVIAVEEGIFRLGFHRVRIRCSSRNLRSASIPQRCGYRFEGVHRHDLQEGDEFRDTMVFAKLASDSRELGVTEFLGVEELHVYVRDVRPSAEWYTAAFGIKPDFIDDNSAAFVLGPQTVTLLPADARLPSGPGGHGVYLKTLAFDRTLQRLMALGAKLYNEPSRANPDKKMAQLIDPHGNLLGITGP